MKIYSVGRWGGMELRDWEVAYYISLESAENAIANDTWGRDHVLREKEISTDGKGRIVVLNSTILKKYEWDRKLLKNVEKN